MSTVDVEVVLADSVAVGGGVVWVDVVGVVVDGSSLVLMVYAQVNDGCATHTS